MPKVRNPGRRVLVKPPRLLRYVITSAPAARWHGFVRGLSLTRGAVLKLDAAFLLNGCLLDRDRTAFELRQLLRTKVVSFEEDLVLNARL